MNAIMPGELAFIFFAVLVLCFIARVLVYIALQDSIQKALDFTDRAFECLNQYGDVVDVQGAAKLFEYHCVKATQYYAQAVPFAAFLVWPFVNWKKSKMVMAYLITDETSMHMAAADAWLDLRLFKATLPNPYYYPDHLRGLLNSLKTITLFG